MAALGHACQGRPDLARIFLEIQVRAALAGNNLEGPVRALVARVGAALDVSAFEFAHIEAVLRIQRSGGRAGFAQAAGARSRGRGARGGLPGARDLRRGEQRGGRPRRTAAQLQRHHPDKLKANGLPDSMMAHAKQRTQQIIEAWDLVRERRGIR